MFHFIDKHAMAAVIGLSPYTLKRYRLQGTFIPVNQKVATLQLKKWGCQANVVGNGEEVL